METNSRRVPPDKRKRTEVSCDKCKSRKQKCDRLLDRSRCRYCEINGIVCSTTQPRKQHNYVHDEDLRSRLDLLESLVKGLIPEADLSCNEELQHLGTTLGIPLPSRNHRHTLVSEKRKEKVNNGENQQSASLLPDQQGHVQYIGPSSSFAFHNKLRTLMGSQASREFAMFGQNAAGSGTGSRAQTLPSVHQVEPTPGSEATEYRAITSAAGDGDGSLLNSLVDTYFDTVHPDFPVLQEASFREQYEIWTISSSTTSPVWKCSLFCVLLLSLRVTQLPMPETMEELCWTHTQNLLPTVLFTTNIHTIQALLLAALHLHNNNHRDACWNLTGAALHVAIAMGLHRDDIKHAQGPFQREFRKQLWWTLYGFEKMQVSSYDRPSGSDTSSVPGYPNERIVGCAGHYPQGFLKPWQQVLAILGSACKAISTIESVEGSELYARPLSPVSAIIREITRWKDSLSPHLRPEAIDTLPLPSRRPVLLLHAQASYVTILVSKSALLTQASSVSGPGREATDNPASLRTLSETCIAAGQMLAEIICKLDRLDRFNASTWWDTFYAMNAALVLSLDILCQRRSVPSPSSSQPSPKSQVLLSDLKTLVAKHNENPRVPGSMRAWGAIVVDLATLSAQTHETTLTPQYSGVDTDFSVEDTVGGRVNGRVEAITLEHFNLLQTSFQVSNH